MEVIDKRKVKKDEKCKVGDVICFYNSEEAKEYGIISENVSNKKLFYTVTPLNVSAGGGLFSEETIEVLIDRMKGLWNHLEKVNAHLVVED